MIQQVESTIKANTLDGRHEEDINIHDHFQARAAANNGKGADENNTVPEIIKNLPYKATTHIHEKFNITYNHTNSTTTPHKPYNNNEQPTRWQNTNYNGLQKHANAKLLKDHRWIAKLDHYRQWYNKGWLPMYIIPHTSHHNPRSYGFEKRLLPTGCHRSNKRTVYEKL